MTLGIDSGLAGSLVKNLVAFILEQLKLIDCVFCEMAGGLFLGNPVYQGSRFLATLIGYLADSTLSIILGVSFVYFIEGTGNRFLVIKGVSFGAVVWFLIFGGVMSFGVSPVRETHPVHILLLFLLHLIFGLSLGLTVEWWGQPTLDREKLK